MRFFKFLVFVLVFIIGKVWADGGNGWIFGRHVFPAESPHKVIHGDSLFYSFARAVAWGNDVDAHGHAEAHEMLGSVNGVEAHTKSQCLVEAFYSYEGKGVPWVAGARALVSGRVWVRMDVEGKQRNFSGGAHAKFYGRMQCSVFEGEPVILEAEYTIATDEIALGKLSVGKKVGVEVKGLIGGISNSYSRNIFYSSNPGNKDSYLLRDSHVQTKKRVYTDYVVFQGRGEVAIGAWADGSIGEENFYSIVYTKAGVDVLLGWQIQLGEDD